MKAQIVSMLAAALATSTAPAPISEYRNAAATLAEHDDGFGMLDVAPDAPAALRQYEKAVQAWAADWFDHHRAAEISAFAKAGRRLDKDLDAAALKLDQHSVLVRANHGQLGTVFILSDRSGRYRLAWDIGGVGAMAPISNGRELAAWAPNRAGSNCSRTSRGSVCGPLFGFVGSLPPTATKEPRFYVRGLYGQVAGATGGQQLSIWTWDGAKARPVLVHLYAVMADQDGPKVMGNLIRVPAKGSFKHMYACGACVGRELQIEIRLDSAKGAELVGERSLTPELDLVDQVYDLVLKGKPADAVAASRVIDRVRAEVKGARPDDYPLGMIDSWTVSGTGDQRTLCLASESDAGSHLFTFAQERGRLKITDIELTKSECDGPGARN